MKRSTSTPLRRFAVGGSVFGSLGWVLAIGSVIPTLLRAPAWAQAAAPRTVALRGGEISASPERATFRSAANLEDFLKHLVRENRTLRRSEPKRRETEVAVPELASARSPAAGRGHSSESLWAAGPGELQVFQADRVHEELPVDRTPRVPKGLLDPLDLRVEYGARPAYAPEPGYQPLLGSSEEPDCERREAFQRMLKKQFYRHTRRLLKKYWREQFSEGLEFSHRFYESRIAQINQIGRSPESYDSFNTEQYLNEARALVLQEGEEGERELTLLELGPFRFDDGGSLHFDLPSLFSHGRDLRLSFDPDAPGAAALYSGETVRILPRLKVRVDPLRALGESWEEAIRSYGGSLRVEFYSDIAHRRLFEAELEASLRPSGEYAFFFNLVFPMK